jgi:hypothetical protein
MDDPGDDPGDDRALKRARRDREGSRCTPRPLKRDRVVSIHALDGELDRWHLARLVARVAREVMQPRGISRCAVDAAAGDMWTIQWRFPGDDSETDVFTFVSHEEQVDA